MKKKLLAIMVFVGLAMTGLFVSPIKGNAHDETRLLYEPLHKAEYFPYNIVSGSETWGRNLYITDDAEPIEMGSIDVGTSFTQNVYIIVAITDSNYLCDDFANAIQLSVNIYLDTNQNQDVDRVIQANENNLCDNWNAYAIPTSDMESSQLDFEIAYESPYAILCSYADLESKPLTGTSFGYTEEGSDLYDVKNYNNAWGRKLYITDYAENYPACEITISNAYKGNNYFLILTKYDFTAECFKDFHPNAFDVGLEIYSTNQMEDGTAQALEIITEAEFNVTAIPKSDIGSDNKIQFDMNGSAQNPIAIFCPYADLVKTRSDLQAPSVSIPSNYIVNVDNMQSQEQILSHVVVKDDTDPNPKLIVKSSSYDSTKRVVGTYPIVIYGQDASGNKSIEYTFNVIVADATDPSNTGFGTLNQPNNVKLTDAEILAKFTVSDNYSSVDKIKKTLIRNDYSTNWTRPGSYTITCRATDEAGNYKDASSTIVVEDKTLPSNEGSTKTQANNVKLTQEDLLALFTVSDDVSAVGKIKKSILTENYTSHWSVPGSYQITCRATDEAGNFRDATSTIIVEDKTLPTAQGKTLDIEYSNKLTDFKSLFTYSDDITSLDNITFEVLTDDYTEHFSRKGSYTITARFTDEAGNYTDASSVLRVVDRTKPVITVPTEITIGNSTIHTIDALKTKINVTDGYDGVITEYTITDNDDYANHYQTPGRYTLTITAKDSSNNTQSVTIAYIVKDTTSPQVFYDRYFIVLTEGEELTFDMIKSYAAQSLGVSEAAILSIEGDFDCMTVGAYEVSLYMIDGSIQPFTISVGMDEEKHETYTFTWKNFFSGNMENWTNFSAWPAWSIAAWFSWLGIGLAGVVVLAFLFVLPKKKVFKK